MHLVGSSGDASVKKLLFEVTECGYRFWTEDAASRKFPLQCTFTDVISPSLRCAHLVITAVLCA
jgi:hypothetical protein